MKKYSILLLLFIPSLMFSKDWFNHSKSYVDLGFKVGNSVYFSDFLLDNQFSNKFHVGHELSLGLEWAFKKTIFSVDFPALSFNFLIYNQYPNQHLYAGIEIDISFLVLSIGQQKSNYKYFIDLGGIGLSGFFYFNPQDTFTARVNHTITLPLGFKIIWKNNIFFSIEHKIYTPLLKLKIEGYDVSITIGKRFDIK